MTSSDQHGSETTYITLGYLNPLFLYLREQGVSVEPVLVVLSLQNADLQSSDLRLDDSSLNDAFDCAATLCRDDNIGLHAGQRMSLANIGILGHLLMTCTKVSQATNLHTRYQTLVGNGGMSEYHVGIEHVDLRFSDPSGIARANRHIYEFHLAGWMCLVEQLLGNALKPDRIEFPCTAPANSEQQSQFFAGELRYVSGNTMTVRFARRHLEQSLFSGDSRLRESLEVAARQRLAELQGSLAGGDNVALNKVTQFIRKQLPYGPPSIEQAAAYLDVSVRTLQRQLSNDGVNYKTLVDDARKALCNRYIDNSELSLVDVALMLGFAEQSSFQRAFKRWHQVTPGEYRRQQN